MDDEASFGRGLALTGSLAALSVLLIGGAAYFALQNAPEGQTIATATVSETTLEQNAFTQPQDTGLATSMASKTMSALKSPRDQEREAARLAILNHSSGPLEVLTLAEVEALTGTTSQTQPAVTAPAPSQAEVVANATETQSAETPVVVAEAPSAPAVVEAIEDVVSTAANETAEGDDEPAEIELAAATPVTVPSQPIAPRATPTSCVDEIRALAGVSTIYFGSGSAQLDANGLNTLRNLGNLANNCPQVVVQVTGHSDSSGDDATNLALSWQRADNTMAALNLLGIDTSRFEAVGFGARAPYSQGDSSDPELDRRVEFQILTSN